MLFGEFHSIDTDEAVRRLESLGAHVRETVTDETDLMFFADGEQGPIPRTEHMLRVPQFDEVGLIGLLERGEGRQPPACEEPPPFLPQAASTIAPDDDEALYALLEDADWTAFTPDRDLPPLRARLADLERHVGVTETHRLATRRLLDTGKALLRHSYGHDAEIVGHAMSPDGRYLATGSWYPEGDYDQGGVMQIWEVASGRCVNTISDIEGGVGWPDYERTIQWSADSSRLAVIHAMSVLGLWSATGEDARPLATISASDGNPRPSPFAFAPDGRSVYYHCTTNGDGGLQGCVVPLDRGALFWTPCHVTTDHPYAMARDLPTDVRDAFRRAEVAEDVGQWIDDPVWTPDGKFLIGSNAICVDAETRAVVWHKPASIAASSPDGRCVAVTADDGLSFLDSITGRPQGSPFLLDMACALRWADARRDRLAVLTARSGTAEPAVHIFDAGEHVGSASIPHPQWQDGKRWSGDRNAWVWAPDGESAAVLTDTDTVEVWSFADPARSERLRAFPASGICAVLWGADDTLVLVGGRRIRFVRTETGATVGDFTLLLTPDEPRPVEGFEAYEFERQVFALDEDTWAMTLDPDIVIAPSDRAEELDSVLTWAVGRRHAWPVRWGDLRVLPDVVAAADVLPPEVGDLLRECAP